MMDETTRAADGCACALRMTLSPRRYRRVRRGMLWVDELEPETRAAACGETPCGPCAEKARAEAAAAARGTYGEGAASAVPPTSYETPAAAAKAPDMPSVVTDPSGWLRVWQASMRAARGAGRAAGTEPDPYAWFAESDDLQRRRTELEQRDAELALNPSADAQRQLDNDWSSLSIARKREIATALANGATRDQAERARLISTALTQGIGALNRILDGEYGIVLARINAQRDIELARINGRNQTERLLLSEEQTRRLALTTPPANSDTSNNSNGLMIVAVVIILAVTMGKRR